MTTDEDTRDDGAQGLRAALRTDLVGAMRARRPEVVATLRGAIAAIDNAEAVEVPSRVADAGSGPVAGARTGVGSTEAARRTLSADDVRAVLRAQIAECAVAADRCDAHRQPEAAARLRREAEVLRGYLGG
ncbi:hypothetical protein [Blastococcus tunisiensis]|uniref:Yqey-like protein n=1 Tax=Blastococcus tunisiensis TaxID=1798228 RepID=A0A1I2DUG4_9ACTN|nr:hypothetical protein [Blastococcus sp. DSM 46838]SFE84302.1 hypothetical protein SAMN05216574_106136 [Blastococcus sp. DSM 46838]